MRIAFALALFSLCACTEPNPNYCEADDDCEAGEVCDLEGELGLKNACIPGPDGGD